MPFRLSARHRPSVFWIAVGFAWLARPAVAPGQAGLWSAHGPVGGSAYCVVADPSHPSTLYAGTRQGVFKSDDAGASWRSASAGLPAVSRVQTIAIDSTTTGTLYAGTITPNGVESIGIFKSTDGATSWIPVNDGLIDPLTFIEPLDVEALAVDPHDHMTLLAGTRFSEIFKSTDGGATWQPETFGGFNVGLETSAFQYDPSNPSTVYAAGTLGLLRSTDSGDTWSQYGNAGVPFFALAIDPTSAATLYAGDATGSGIWKSTDSGAHWSQANNSLPVIQGASGPQEPEVIALALDPANASILYAGTYGNGLFVSRDGAASWAAADSGMRSSYVSAFAFGPGAAIRAGTLGGGIYQSLDGAQSWSPTNAGLNLALVFGAALDSAAPGTVYAAAFDGVAKSGDDGASWQAVDNGLPADAVSAIALLPGNPETLFAATLGGGLLESTDDGATWSARAQGLTDPYVSSIGIDPSSPSTLYAGTAHPDTGSNSERVFKSIDGGATWVQTGLNAQSNPVDFVVVNPTKPSQVIAGSIGVVGYFQSDDGGTSWSTVTASTSCGGTNALIFPPSGSTIYIAGTAGVCRSADSGKTWAVSPVGGSLSATALLSHPQSSSILYAGTSPPLGGSSGGVFRSTDGGQTWEALGSGFPPAAVTALAIDTSGKTLHAATYGAGVAELALKEDRAPIEAPPNSSRRARVVPPR